MAAANEPCPKRLKSSNVISGAPGEPGGQAMSNCLIKYKKSDTVTVNSLEPSAPLLSDLYPHISSYKTFDVFFQKEEDTSLAELYKFYPTSVVLNCINVDPYSWHLLDITLKKQYLELNFVLSNIGHTHPHISRKTINMFCQHKYCPELNTLYNLYPVEVVLECININFSTWNILDINSKKKYLDIFIDTQKLF